ncbi:MAG: 50S ribosomal protein L5 [Patescibacteria group bacterium]
MSLINVKEAYGAKLNDLKTGLGIANPMALPKISKVSINVGLGQHRQDKDMVKYIADSLRSIAGQAAVPTTAKKAIAGFKIRQGDVVGYRVTLRGQKMTDFINRLLNISLPRIREFKGIDVKKLDKQGNLTIGLRDQIPFAELGNDAIDKQFGLTITFTIKNSDQNKSAVLLKTLGFPMKTE